MPRKRMGDVIVKDVVAVVSATELEPEADAALATVEASMLYEQTSLLAYRYRDFTITLRKETVPSRADPYTAVTEADGRRSKARSPTRSARASSL